MDLNTHATNESNEVTFSSVYQNAFRTSPAASLLLSTDPDAIVLAVSEAFAQAFSIQPKRIVGVSLLALPGLASIGCESTREGLRRSVALVVATGRPDSVVLYLPFCGQKTRRTEANGNWRVEHAPVQAPRARRSLEPPRTR